MAGRRTFRILTYSRLQQQVRDSSNNPKIKNLLKFRPAGPSCPMRTHVTKPKVAFRNYANAPKNVHFSFNTPYNIDTDFQKCIQEHSSLPRTSFSCKAQCLVRVQPELKVKPCIFSTEFTYVFLNLLKPTGHVTHQQV